MVYLGAGALFIVGVSVAVTLWATGSFRGIGGGNGPTNSTGGLAPGQPSKTVWEKISIKRSVVVSGELFVTTKGGDVKKAAGQKVQLTPITPEFAKNTAAMLRRVDGLNEESRAAWDKGYEKYLRDVEHDSPDYKAREAAFDKEFPQYKAAIDEITTLLNRVPQSLTAGASSTVADSEGKFKIEIPQGKYVLWTPARSMGEQSFSWCKAFEAKDSPLNLVLSEDAVFLYGDTFGDPENHNSVHRLLREIVFETVGKKDTVA